MGIGWTIGFVASSLVFFVGFIVASSYNYRKKFHERFSIKNHFPYEYNYNAPFSDNILGNFSLIVSILLGLACFLTFAPNYQNGMCIFILVSGVVSSILVPLAIFIPLKYFRTHLAINVMMFAFVLMSNAAIGITGLDLFRDFNDPLMLVTAILGFAVGVILFILLMNPRLSLSFKAEKSQDEEGNEIYLRPKWIILAFSEWVVVLSYYLSQLILLLLVITL